MEEKISSKDDIQILAQLVEAMDEAVAKMEHYFEKRDIENFNRSRKIVLEFQAKIAEVVQDVS